MWPSVKNVRWPTDRIVGQTLRTNRQIDGPFIGFIL